MELFLLILIALIAVSICVFFGKKNKQLSLELQTAREQLLQAEREKIRLEERAHALDDKQTEQEKFFNKLQQQSQDTFKQLAADALKAQKEDLITKNTDMYNPLKEKMAEFTKQLGDLRNESTSHHSVLKTALERTLTLNENLAKEAQDLTTALKNPKKQGTWGEIILEEVLSSAGLREGIEFDKQVSLKTEDGSRQQPDFIIHLPHNRDIIIDSKMSLNSYTKWASSTDEEEKKVFLKEHVRAVEEHIKELAAKDYPKLLKNEKLDFTLMFIPIEYAYFAAFQENPALNDMAREKRIGLVTASNLFSVLQVVDNLWRMERSSKTIEQIFKIAQDMHERVGRFTDKMTDLKNRIASLDKTYEEASKSLLGRQSILTSAKQLEQLRIKSAKKLPELAEDSAVFPELESQSPEEKSKI